MNTVVFSERVLFHDDLQVMEVDFSNVIVSDSSEVNHFYDQIERQIEATGTPWFLA